jgi:hypothetical protein
MLVFMLLMFNLGCAWFCMIAADIKEFFVAFSVFMLLVIVDIIALVLIT